MGEYSLIKVDKILIIYFNSVIVFIIFPENYREKNNCIFYLSNSKKGMIFQQKIDLIFQGHTTSK